MGSWGPGPFDNDAALDFLGEMEGAPARVVTRTIERIAGWPAGEYLDVDDGSAGWAACELVAMSFGRGDTTVIDARALAVGAGLAPREDQRVLAIRALHRLADPTRSELTALWHEGAEGPLFDARLVDLLARLHAAGAGAGRRG